MDLSKCSSIRITYLASADPVQLRKLHAVVGSVIFIDESHACLPPALLKLTWHWLRQLTSIWGCQIVFSSGSMLEFWNKEDLVGIEATQILPDLLDSELLNRCQQAERYRVRFFRELEPYTLDSLLIELLSESRWQEYLLQVRPCCLVILNTVQSAAVVANALSNKLGDKENALQDKVVLHLSTALSPASRVPILLEIERRQKDIKWQAKPWYLVATSCVEAGIDLDFSMAYRESCSVTSFLQVAGRVNRHGARESGNLYSFKIVAESNLCLHPSFESSSRIFEELWDDLCQPDASLTQLVTKSLNKEFTELAGKPREAQTLLEHEEKRNFQEVQAEYKLIKSNTLTVLVNKDLINKLEVGIPVKFDEIQKHSVQLWVNKVAKLQLIPVRGSEKDGIYAWTESYEYDSDFLGIMAGLLKPKAFFTQELGVL